ncbi:hypothetical protein ACQBAU_16155 [Propionibacteriaceae bacterium Y2011]
MITSQWPSNRDDFADRVDALAKRITYHARSMGLLIRRDGLPRGRWFIQLTVERRDSITGELGVGKSGRAYLSRHMTDSEIVQAIFGLIKGYEEHECREWFRLDGVAIYGPHIDYRALLVAAKQTDARTVPATQGASDA